MKLYRDEAIVLCTHKLGEADRIITLLTRSHGQVRAVAKGVRRTSSRFGARLEPFSMVDLQLHRGRSLDIVTQAESLAAYGRLLAANYPLYTCATVMVETAERLTSDVEDSGPQQYLLLVGALHSLATRRHPAQLVLDSYLLRALAIGGWAPSFHDCAACGSPGPHRGFHVDSGGAVCAECRPAGSATPQPETFELLGSLLSGDWESADATPQGVRSEASGLVTAYLQWHLERQVRSLRLVERT
ncbi:MAG TPA: DNA repair protein RecO [Actinomycetaceae bacterium]|nr:DNA repair protein RecO [Actinomycetaceae bacterium]